MDDIQTTMSGGHRGTAIVIAGGDPLPAGLVADLVGELGANRVAYLGDSRAGFGLVIAADSGLDHAHAAGLRPDVVIGDMDSVDPALLADAAADGVEILRHPASKDATDLELALAHAHAEGHRRIVVIGGTGGRISHLLANASLLAGPVFADTEMEWRTGDAVIGVVRPDRSATIVGTVGDLVSLVPIGGGAEGVTTDRLRWPLSDATLPSGSTRGISNEMTDTTAAVSLRGGVMLAIHERTM